VKRNSRFVSFHALQVLLLQAGYFLAIMFFMVIVFALVVSQVLLTHTGQQSSDPPFVILMVFPFFWLFMMGRWVVLLLAAILFCIKAGRGEWAEYPLLGGLARKMLGVGPGGAAKGS
jgi:uncharacterized membrane protein